MKDKHRYVVGVGSIGLPEDGYWAAYAIFDTHAQCIDLLRLDRDHSVAAL